MIIYTIMFLRAYCFAAAILLLNAIAILIFSPSWRAFKYLVRTIPFILIWPLAMFSHAGRGIIFQHVQHLKD